MGLPDKISRKQKNFYNYLKKFEYAIHFRPVSETRTGGHVQKGIDILIYKHIIELAEVDSYDKAVLVSGDADFIDVVKELKEFNKKIEIWSFKISLSKKLIRVSRTKKYLLH